MRILFLLAFFFSFSAYSKSKLDSILIHADGTVFSIKEPVGWKCECENTAEVAKLGANAVLVKANESIQNPTALIRVRINNKTDEKVEEDLKADMSQYQKQYPDVSFENLEVPHKKYKTCPKLFLKKGTFAEYVTYVNPGSKIKKIFSVSMNIQKRTATDKELSAYKEVVASLKFIK